MKVSIRIFDEDERKFLETILDLAARRLKIPLEHVASGVADVVFLKVDEPGASLLINASQVRKRPMVVVYGSAGYPWTLEKPATSRLLVDLLGRLAEALGMGASVESGSVVAGMPHGDVMPEDEPEEAAAPTPASAAVAAAPAGVVQSAGGQRSISPLLPVAEGMLFMERVREIAGGRSQWICALDNNFVVAVDGQAGKVYFPDEYTSRHSEIGRLSLGIDEANMRRVAVTDPLWVAYTRGASMPLESYLWLVAQLAQPLGIEPGSPLLARRFRLQRWPSFSRILHGSPHIVMSGRLMKRAMTLTELVEVTGESLDSVMRFYNSACICGLLQASGGSGGGASRPAMPANESAVDAGQLQEIRKGKAGIFSRVLKRLLG